MTILDLSAPVADVTRTLVDTRSVSGEEEQLADAVETALRDCAHLDVTRHGHTVVARTSLGREQRVVVAGHLDTVPINDNFPSHSADGKLWGIGSCDMKGGVAVGLKLAAGMTDPRFDVTYVFYECEEVEFDRNGLGLLARTDPDLLTGDFAVVMEPTDGVVEAGCQGSMRVDVVLRGERAHSARSWRGHNAIHDAAEVLRRLAAYEARRPVVDGLEYHEGMNAVGISGGVAGNVIPDLCTVSVNHRFAPDRDVDEAFEEVRRLFDGFEVKLMDSAPAARPGLGVAAAQAFVASVGAATGAEPRPKFGWTDVARFSELGVPAVNFGPGDPMYAHKADEHVVEAQIGECEQAMRGWLGAQVAGGNHG